MYFSCCSCSASFTICFSHVFITLQFSVIMWCDSENVSSYMCNNCNDDTRMRRCHHCLMHHDRISVGPMTRFPSHPCADYTSYNAAGNVPVILFLDTAKCLKISLCFDLSDPSNQCLSKHKQSSAGLVSVITG